MYIIYTDRNNSLLLYTMLKYPRTYSPLFKAMIKKNEDPAYKNIPMEELADAFQSGNIKNIPIDNNKENQKPNSHLSLDVSAMKEEDLDALLKQIMEEQEKRSFQPISDNNRLKPQ